MARLKLKNQEDREAVAIALIRAGYMVRITQEPIQGKTTCRYYLEYEEPSPKNQ